MALAIERPIPSRLRSAVSRWLRLLGIGIFSGFAVVGLVTALVFFASFANWTITDLQNLFVFDKETQGYLKWIWAEVKTALQYISFFLIAIALFLAVIRMRTVAKIISDFLLARGPIYSLQGTIERVSETVEKLSHLEPTIQLLNEKIDAAQEQVAELQRYTSSQSSQHGGENWETLRALWYANTHRIEGVIDRIGNARRKQRYRKMPRTDYTPIIAALAKDRLIRPPAEEASIKLDKLFKDYLSGKETLTDAAVEELRVLDAMLEDLIGSPRAEQDEELPNNAPG